jgi:hypothetical protein
MKKIYLITIFVMLVILAVAMPVFAIPGKGAIKGEVVAVDPEGGTVTLETRKTDFVVVKLPTDSEAEIVKVGDWMLVKGTLDQDGILEAEWVKPIGNGNGIGNEAKAEGKKDNSAFCDPEKQDKFHPLAEKVGERYAVGEEWVMDYFCDGYGMGAIMLALKTSQLEGSDAGALLEMRAEGKGWGRIWLEKGLVGSEKEGFSPPGLLKKAEFAGSKNADE